MHPSGAQRRLLSPVGAGTLGRMGGKTAIGLGLASGVLAGGLAVGALIALAPGPVAPVVVASPSPSEPGFAASGAPSGTASQRPAASGGSPAPSASSPAEAFGVGEPAPPLELPGVGGEPVNLADYLGRPVWVNFMATWCPPCHDELPLMAGFQARFDDAGLVVIAVDVREDEPTVQAFFADMGLYSQSPSMLAARPRPNGARSRFRSTSGSTKRDRARWGAGRDRP